MFCVLNEMVAFWHLGLRKRCNVQNLSLTFFAVYCHGKKPGRKDQLLQINYNCCIRCFKSSYMVSLWYSSLTVLQEFCSLLGAYTLDFYQVLFSKPVIGKCFTWTSYPALDSVHNQTWESDLQETRLGCRENVITLVDKDFCLSYNGLWVWINFVVQYFYKIIALFRQYIRYISVCIIFVLAYVNIL